MGGPDERLTLAQAARAIRAGRLSPVDLTEACLARTTCVDPVVHAFARLDADGARAASIEAERELRAGDRRGPLHGIPIGVKDVIDVAGLPTVAGSRRRMHARPASRDAASVARLRAGGAIILGKLTTHEFAFGIPDESAPTPPARNPWMPSRFAGGSSSGAAVASACGLTLGALGSDTAGSVRSPAALCGVAGFKPGAARVDRAGALPLAPSLDALGVLATSVEDCAVLYAALAGPADAALHAVRDDDGLPRLDADLRGLRIGVIRHFFQRDALVTEPCAAAIDTALAEFERLGCRIRDVTLAPLERWHAAGLVILLTEAFAYHAPGLREHDDDYGRSFSDAVRVGATLSASDYGDAVAIRRGLTARFDAVMDEVDLLVCAIQPGEAPPFAELSPWGFLERPSYGLPFNLTDSPALSVCCGFGPNGLPLALQLIGRRGDELTVLRAGHAYEQRAGWHRRTLDLSQISLT